MIINCARTIWRLLLVVWLWKPLHGFAFAATPPNVAGRPCTSPSDVTRGKPMALENREHNKKFLSAAGNFRSLALLQSVERGGGAEVEDYIERESRKKALASVEKCYKMAFGSFAVYAAAEIFATGMRYRTPIQHVLAVAQIFHRLGFGTGLYRLTCPVKKKDADTVSLGYVKSAEHTMIWLWRPSAWLLVFSAAVFSESIVPGVGPVVTVSVALLGSVILRIYTGREAQRQVKLLSLPSLSEEAESVRKMGFLVARNMSFCFGAFLLLGFIQFATILMAKYSHLAEPLPKLSKLSNVTACLTFARLIFQYHRAYLRNAVLMSNNFDSKTKTSVGADLYDAEIGFYNDVASTLKSETTVMAHALAIKAIEVVQKALGCHVV